MFTLRLLKIKIHSRRVLMFKRSLPIFAFLLASMVFIWPAAVKNKDKFNLAVPAPTVKTGANVDMEQVRFFSKDKQQQPLTVLAAAVQETDSNQKIIRLDKPIATYEMNDGIVLKSVTSVGFAYQQQNYLFFDKEVLTTTNNGYVAWSSGVKCDYDKGTLASAHPVLVRGVGGTLTADGFYMADKGDILNFKGQSRAVLFDVEKPMSAVSDVAAVRTSKQFEARAADLILTAQNGIGVKQSSKAITALGNAQMRQMKTTLDADKIIIYYNEKKGTKTNRVRRLHAVGQAKVTQPGNIVYADSMIFYSNKTEINKQLETRKLSKAFAKSGAKQLIVATGHVKALEGENTIVADEMIVFADNDTVAQKMKKVVAIGNVKAFNKTQQILGDVGEYDPKTGLVKMTGHVFLSEGETRAHGETATLNLNTGVSTLNGANNSNGRVKGSLIPAEM